MSLSRADVNELRKQDVAAWTELFRRSESLPDARVLDVVVEPLNESGLVRYLLTLDGCSDPVAYVGKQTNKVEAGFYRDVAPSIRRLVPTCRLHHISHDWSWLVLDEVPNHQPPPRWTGDAVERVVFMLASFHGTFWQEEDELAPYKWLDFYLEKQQVMPEDGYLHVWQAWDRMPGHQSSLSLHGVRSAGRLAPTFIRAAVGLETLRQLGGWPGLIDKRHLEALGDLLDDPLPMLHPLRQMPVTLLHGNPAPHHWHITLFNDYKLLDWSRVSLGPAVLDLVAFLEATALFHSRFQHPGKSISWPILEETIVDSYLLRMNGLPGFDARLTRNLLPAALCLHVLSVWLPRFADWFQPFVGSPVTWQRLTEMSDQELQRVGYGRLAGLDDYLADLFVRFYHASKML